MSNLILYMAKCVTGAAIVFLLSSLFHYSDIGWCMISVVLVLSPDGREAIPFALTRIKANITGGMSSLACLLIGPPGIITMGLSFVLTIGLCYFFKLMAGNRTALAAAVIVMLHSPGSHVWDAALERILAVIVGCVLGMLVTFLFHSDFYRAHRGIAPRDDGE